MATATSRSQRTRPSLTRRARRYVAERDRRFAPLYAVGVLLLLFLVKVALLGSAGILLTFAVTVGLLAVVALGPERLGLVLFGVAFLTAPFNRGTIIQAGSPSVTITDLAMVGGTLLLLPRLFHNGVRLAAAYVGGVGLVLATGLFASTVMTEDTGTSLKTLIGWMFCMAVIPVVLSGLRPSRRLVQTYAWCFVATQVFDTLYSIAKDPTTGIRHMGLTQHPNAFAQGGMLAFALLLYLRHFSRHRFVVYSAMLISLVGVYLSGSRGGTLAVGALILAVPLVERSAASTTGFVFVSAMGAIGLAVLLQNSSQDSSLSRLTGTGDAAYSDNERHAGIHDGINRFLIHPLAGNGLVDLAPIHINLLEILVGCGILGLVGFLLALWAIARPLVGRSPDRLLALTVVGFSVFGATAPALADRTAWLPMVLSLAVFHGYAEGAPPGSPEGEDADEAADPLIVDARGSTSLRDMSGRLIR